MFGIENQNLPAVLKDDNRLNVLFAPLRNKSVNPKDWEDKISTWKSIIRIYCETNDIYSFNITHLNNVFVRHGRPPSCLNEVLDDMVRNREIQPKDVFLKNQPTWSGWIADIVIKKPFSWSYNTIKNTVFTTAIVDKTYVHLEVIVKKSEELLLRVPKTSRNEIMSFKDLLELLNKDVSHMDNLKLLLHYLSGQKKVATKVISGTNIHELDSLIIKIGDGHTQVCITDLDIGIYKLQENEKVLTANIEHLEDRIEKCIAEAKEHLKKNHRKMAKNSLLKKHALEKQVEKKGDALLNIQNCLVQLKGSHDNANIWGTYKMALDAFNATYKETGLAEEAVDNTLSHLADALDQHEDIQTALANLPSGDFNTTELEQELEDLLKEDLDNANNNPDEPPNDASGKSDDLEERFNKLRFNLPDVPETSPDISTQEAI